MVTGFMLYKADTPNEIFLNQNYKNPPLPGLLANDLPLSTEDIILTLHNSNPNTTLRISTKFLRTRIQVWRMTTSR